MTTTAPAKPETMTPEQRAVSRFAGDVADHRMTIVADVDGVRHLRFNRPGSSHMAFQVTTWPYHLTISGDMGTLVLTNHDTDMLGWATDITRTVPDLHYWGQKVVEEIRPSLKEFSPRVLVEHVKEYVGDMPYAKANELIARAESFDSNEGDAAREWVYDHFQDGWEWDLTQYTFRTVWLMMALQMAANQYLEATCPWDRVLTVGKVFPARAARALPNPQEVQGAVITGYTVDQAHTGSCSLVTVEYTHEGGEHSLPLNKFLATFREPTTAELEAK